MEHKSGEQKKQTNTNTDQLHNAAHHYNAVLTRTPESMPNEPTYDTLGSGWQWMIQIHVSSQPRDANFGMAASCTGA